MADHVYDQSSGELYHYGVLGMRWGIHRAKKKGETYNYKSHGQKKYEKRLTDYDKKGVSKDSRQYQKAEDKRKLYEVRDKARLKYAKKTNVGKTMAKGLLMGPFGSGNYNRMRAMNIGRAASFMASNVIMSTLTLPVSVIGTKVSETRNAKHVRDMKNLIGE